MFFGKIIESPKRTGESRSFFVYCGVFVYNRLTFSKIDTVIAKTNMKEVRSPSVSFPMQQAGGGGKGPSPRFRGSA